MKKLLLIFVGLVLASWASVTLAQAAYGSSWNCTVTVSTTATQLICPANASKPTTKRLEVCVAVPSGGSTTFIGGSNVTAANGGNGLAAAETGCYKAGKLALYGIVSSGTQAVDLYEVYP